MSPDTDLKELRVAVTGGTSGLGLALVRLLAAGGAHVAFVARTARAVERTASETGAHGIVGDVGRKDDIYPIALQITGNLGGLDVLINNASSLGPTPLVPLADTECEELRQALAVNLLGPFRLTKALLGALAASAREGSGSVVINISSDAAVTPYSGWGAYGASKAALRHLTAIWAEEAKADCVRFLSIDPGDMDTPLHALAIPDANPATLRRPEHSASEIVEKMLGALSRLGYGSRGDASMSAADRPDRRSAKLFTIDANGGMRHLPRTELASLLSRGDLVIANDAATLPASLRGTHRGCGEPLEVRLAGWTSARDPTRYVAIAFGTGDHRTRTEDRPPPPSLSPGDRLSLGALVAVVERLLDHPRLFTLRFIGNRETVLGGLAGHGQPIQYAHIPEPLALWDVWTRIAADPIAFEPPSAGFALDWRTLAAWRQRGISFATLTHAAGISSTGDATLDLRLPFDEPYRIPERTAAAIKQAKSEGGRIVAIGTTVVRALESAANADGSVRAGDGVASGRIVPETRLRVVDAILTGVHETGESHFELLQSFADDVVLDHIFAALVKHGYRTHEFGDSILIERQSRMRQH
jgi:S-adenosylmethionine:tRNA ribosyltransferase-isomerase